MPSGVRKHTTTLQELYHDEADSNSDFEGETVEYKSKRKCFPATLFLKCVINEGCLLTSTNGENNGNLFMNSKRCEIVA